MDGINGITGGYAVASLVPLFLINEGLTPVGALNEPVSFVNSSLIVTVFWADCLHPFVYDWMFDSEDW